MKSIALRFSEKFSPECGTIEAHNQVIENNRNKRLVRVNNTSIQEVLFYE